MLSLLHLVLLTAGVFKAPKDICNEGHWPASVAEPVLLPGHGLLGAWNDRLCLWEYKEAPKSKGMVEPGSGCGRQVWGVKLAS